MHLSGLKYLQRQQERFRKEQGKLTLLQDSSLASLVAAERQGWLFHGSPSLTIEHTFYPRPSRLSSKPVVFAGKLWVGLTFMAPWSDAEFEHGTINDEPYMRAMAKDGFNRFKRPGTLYQISPEGFTHLSGLTEYEFVSYQTVTPTSAVFIENPLKLIKQLGVNLA